MNPVLKNILMVIGGLAIVVVIVIAVVAAFFVPRALKLSGEATSYLQDNVPKIVAGWNPQELVDRATPELMRSTKSREQIDQFFAVFSRLGALKHLDAPQGSIFTSSTMAEWTKTVGNYQVRGTFEHGSADVQVQLLRVGEGWQINGFHINSDALFAPAASPSPAK